METGRKWDGGWAVAKCMKWTNRWTMERWKDLSKIYTMGQRKSLGKANCLTTFWFRTTYNKKAIQLHILPTLWESSHFLESQKHTGALCDCVQHYPYPTTDGWYQHHLCEAIDLWDLVMQVDAKWLCSVRTRCAFSEIYQVLLFAEAAGNNQSPAWTALDNFAARMQLSMTF